MRNPVIGREKVTRTSSVALCLFWLLLSAGSVMALDPNRRVSQYGHTAWRMQDGIFNSTPNVITQTADGYLWIGTGAGLLRFDGVRFVPGTTQSGQPLPDVRITSDRKSVV